MLLVDDNPGDVELFRWALDRAGIDYELSVIADGGDAMAMVHGERASRNARPPDLVVLDLNLPKADGREILAEMRSAGVFSETPVMILTSSTSQRDRDQMRALQVARYVSKPHDFEEFMKIGMIVKELLGESGLLQRNGEPSQDG